MNKYGAVVAALGAGLAASVYAQPGDRTALVYGARLAGQTDWQFGSLSLESAISAPLTIEVGTFFYRSQGVGFSFSVYKTYIDSPSTNSIQIVEDLSNGTDPRGDDGRVGVFDFGVQWQRVFTNRHASVPGTGFRIATGTGGTTGGGDLTDGSAAGGISVIQRGPRLPGGEPNPDYETADGVLGFRFNITANPAAFPGEQDLRVFTPLHRVAGYQAHNSLDNNSTIDLLPELQIDPINIHISWVPAPSVAVIFMLAGAAASGRRRRTPVG